MMFSMKITKTSEGYVLSQSHFVKQMHEKLDSVSEAMERTHKKVKSKLK